MRARGVWTATLVLLVAACLRFVLLSTVPTGLHHDEAYNVLDVREITWEHTPIFFPANTGRQAVYFYWEKLFLIAFGVSILSVRLASATVGILTIALEYAAARRLFGSRPAVLAALVLATLQWHVQTSRVSLRVVLVPALVALTLLALRRGSERLSVGAFAAAGVVAGIAINTYTGALVFPLLPAGYGLYLLASRPRHARAWILGVAAATATCAVLAAPLALYLRAHPTSLVRLDQVGAIHADKALAHAVGAIASNVARYAGSFAIRGDANTEWVYNVPGWPIFDPPMAALFAAGLLWLAWAAIRRPGRGEGRDAAILCLLALVIMEVPGILSGDAPYYTRTTGILPIVALAPAVAADCALRWQPTGRPRALVWVLLGLALISQAASTIHGYFVTWARAPEVAYNFASGATAIAGYLRAERPDGDLFISTGTRPTVEALAGTMPAAHWFDAGQILPISTGSTGAAYYLFDLDQASVLEAAMRSAGTLVLNARDPHAHIPIAHGYRVPAAAMPAFPTADGSPIDFGASLSVAPVFVGPDPDEAGSVAVVLGLRALRASPGYLSLSVRAVDGAGRIWAQHDGLGDDLTTWAAGQRAFALHRLHLYRGTPPGGLSVRVQVYDLATGRPLQRDDGLGTDVVVGPIAVPPEGLPDPVAPWLEPSQPLANGAPSSPIRIVRVGTDATSAIQGETISVGVVWERTGPLDPGARLQLELRDRDGVETREFTTPDLGLSAPDPSAALANRPTLDRRALTLPPRWPPGPSIVRAVVRNGAGATIERVTLATVDVRGLPREQTAPAISRAVDAAFANGIRLVGLAPAQPWDARRATVRLVWRADAAPAGRYTVFTHLIDDSGRLVAQHDGPPAAGAWPTDTWLPGQFVVDEHAIPLTPGQLQRVASVEIGMYDEKTHERLPVIPADGISSPGDAVRLPLGGSEPTFTARSLGLRDL